MNYVFIGIGSITLGTGSYFRYLKNKPKEEKLNIVFDLEGTLMHSQPFYETKSLSYDFRVCDNDYIVWKRPFYTILYPLSKIANLHIFSSGEKDCVEEFKKKGMLSTTTEFDLAKEVINKMYTTDIFDTKRYSEDWVETKTKDLLKINDNLDNVVLVDDNILNRNSSEQQFYQISEYNPYNKFDTELLSVFSFVVKSYIKNDWNNVVRQVKNE